MEIDESSLTITEENTPEQMQRSFGKRETSANL